MSQPPTSNVPAAPVPMMIRPHFSNLLGVSALEDNLQCVSDFLFQHIDTPDIEIEAKLGLQVRKMKMALEKQRLYIDGVRTLVPLNPDELDTQFEAEIDANMFRHILENLLFRRYSEDQVKAKAHNAKPYWSYEHKKITDKFYSVGSDRVRVSVDDVSGSVIECIVKEKIAHSDWWNGRPGCVDFRISANREKKVPLPTVACDQVRLKDRHSYTFDLWRIDVSRVELYTKVTATGTLLSDRPAAVSHEVELELRASAIEYVRQEAKKVRANQPNEFVRIASALYDNIRTLTHYAFPNKIPDKWRERDAAAAAAAATKTPPSTTAAQSQQQQLATAAVQQATKKRKLEEEQQKSTKDEWGKVWS